jgi:regulator of sirC expression with transglutaminase-like and TPR domain
MEPAVVIPTLEGLPERQRAALVSLLADDDPAVYHAIREKILSFGETARDWLRPHTLSSDPVLRRRVHEIIRHFNRLAADNNFLAFCLKHGEDFDLEESAWLLAQTQFPEINVEAYHALLDSYAGELRQRIDPHGRADRLLGQINHYLFVELGFTGNERSYYDPENSYLNCVLDRRTGNPINLCLIYMLLARRLGLPIAGIGLPGHFICRHQSASGEIYIDAFYHGRLMTKTECLHYLVRGNFDLRDDCLAPVSARRMFLRICGNLHQVYQHLALTEETTRLQRYLIALAR